VAETRDGLSPSGLKSYTPEIFSLAFLQFLWYEYSDYWFTGKVGYEPTFLLGASGSMASDTDIVARIKQIAEPIVQCEGMELVDLEFRPEKRGRVLRLIIDREGGITLDHCASISREVDKNLDIAGIPPGPYTLEVSSPGLNRPLKRQADFDRFRNRQIKVKTAMAIGGRKTFRGRLLAYQDGIVEIEQGNGVTQIPFDQIVKANLEYEF
jgi:ribosome maturation factor RimP